MCMAGQELYIKTIVSLRLISLVATLSLYLVHNCLEASRNMLVRQCEFHS